MLSISAGLVEGMRVLFYVDDSICVDLFLCCPVYPCPDEVYATLHLVLQKVMAGANTVPAGPLHAVPVDDGQFAAAE